MSEITTTIDNNTYQEINLNDHPLISDDQPNVPNIFDARTRLYMNPNGDILWTTGGTSEEAINEKRFRINERYYYNFDKPNQKDGNSFSNLGKEFFTKDIPNDEKVEHLKKVEKELIKVLNNEYEKRKKTNSDQVKPLITKSKGEIENQADEGADIYGLQEKFQEIRQSDRTLQRLSLRNLKYPIDADYGNTQDYIEINQFTYKAVNPSVIFPQKGFRDDDGNFIEGSDSPDYKGGGIEENAFKAGGRVASSTFRKGLDRGSPKNIPIGLVKLPMPNQLNDSNNIAWGEDQLNALTAAAATLGAGGLQQGIDFFQDIADGKVKGFDILGKILGGAGDAGKSVLKFLNEAKGERNSNLLARSVVGSSLLNLAGIGISPETILARGAGVIPNSNLELLFNAPALRAFRFDWKMSPRSKEEAIRVNNIIRFFKQGMAAKKMMEDSPGGSAYFLGTPNVFDINFKTSKTNRGITNTNNSVLRIKTCACVGAAVNYTPQGMWNAYEEGQPTSCILSLQFKELEPLFNTDYDEDPFSYGDLTGFIPSDAVGY